MRRRRQRWQSWHKKRKAKLCSFRSAKGGGGEHELTIHAPPGFYSKNETLLVKAGEARTVTIRLDGLAVAATSDATVRS